jgi:hypothetical protein
MPAWPALMFAARQARPPLAARAVRMRGKARQGHRPGAARDAEAGDPDRAGIDSRHRSDRQSLPPNDPLELAPVVQSDGDDIALRAR